VQPAATPGPDRHVSVVCPRDGLHDGQAQAEPAAVVRGFCGEPLERLEHAVYRVRRYLRPGVDHSDERLARFGSRADRDLPAGDIVPQRVVNQVRDETLGETRVTVRGRPGGRSTDL
jgi:hypothetical protein